MCLDGGINSADSLDGDGRAVLDSGRGVKMVEDFEAS